MYENNWNWEGCSCEVAPWRYPKHFLRFSANMVILSVLNLNQQETQQSKFKHMEHGLSARRTRRRCMPRLYWADGQLYPITSLHPPPAGSKMALKLCGVQCLASIPPSCTEGCFVHCAPWCDTACCLSNPGEHRAAISAVTAVSLAVITKILYSTVPMPFCFCTEKNESFQLQNHGFILEEPSSLQLIYWQYQHSSTATQFLCYLNREQFSFLRFLSRTHWFFTSNTQLNVFLSH